MSHLVSAEQFIAELGDPDLRVIDARYELADTGLGRRLYQVGHVPGAVYFDLDEDLCDPEVRWGELPNGRKFRLGGRHPLPSMERFAETLASRGIGSSHRIVVYDQAGSMYAARAWWLIRYAGHDAVRFLDGGYAAYLAAGGPVSAAVPRWPAGQFRLRLRPEMVIEQGEITARTGQSGFVLLDARAGERFRGETEPLDPFAGHIPGAINRPFAANVANGRLLSPAELADRLSIARPERGAEVVAAYCGSGVSAAHLVLALEEAGVRGAKLYPGSWSEWCTTAGMPLATGPE